ncbi:FadR/GntR family transcriptional regulator [Trueperella pecoris]|uniref:FadR family transcriptional regulator n=1 Tax=Trueperella pecoris TaxID=2733571 RepID=A0A7M1QW65_9ACTO|nr:GntR family transcriptional regulator [Trueperella pecoris]QOQ39275.1 FadR family transcriptional regulator [Trueperella pecoris]QOR46083.1 FadR family transcriptional regulator [Trueperella pecoris]QTG75915.1 FadR family transcriptional regulator [Trueperella pecoris]
MLSDKSAQVLLQKFSPTTMSGRANEPIAAINRSSATMDAVKAYILNHDLKPGDPLPTEAALCETLHVSRSSVREALRKLEALDIVRVHQGRGSFVGDMSLEPMVETLVLRYALDKASGAESLRQVVSMRRYIDLGVANSIVAALKGTDNPGLHELVARMVKKASAGKTYMEEDIAFHSGLMSYLNNELVSQLNAAMWLVHQAFIPELDVSRKASLLETAQAHQKMLETAEAGDAPAYRQAVREHYAPLANILELD